MAKFKIPPNTISKKLRAFIEDSSKGDGSGLTGLVHDTSDLTAHYIRDGDAAPTSIPLVDAVVGAYTSGGFKEISPTDMPGWYELGAPNAVLADGVDDVGLFLKGAPNMVPLPLEIEFDFTGILTGTVNDGAPTASSFDTTIIGEDDDAFIGQIISYTRNINP